MKVKLNNTNLLWCLLLIFTAINYIQINKHEYLTDNKKVRQNKAKISEKINPNTANWPSLARLPGIGEKRAKDIIYYRNKQQIYDNNSTVYNVYNDLAKVKGIGKVTCEKIRDYLIF